MGPGRASGSGRSNLRLVDPEEVSIAFKEAHPMARKVVSGLFDRYKDAAGALHALEAAGFIPEDISIVAYNADNRHALLLEELKSGRAAKGAEAGATVGTVVGGGAALLAGLGVLVIPGIGPVIAAGWLAATAAGAIAGAVVGAATGGIVGTLTKAGVSEEHAHVFAEGIRRGGTLVSAWVDEARAEKAQGIMRGSKAVDLDVRSATYRAAGWKGFDETGAVYDEVKVGDRYRDPHGGHESI